MKATKKLRLNKNEFFGGAVYTKVTVSTRRAMTTSGFHTKPAFAFPNDKFGTRFNSE